LLLAKQKGSKLKMINVSKFWFEHYFSIMYHTFFLFLSLPGLSIWFAGFLHFLVNKLLAKLKI